jgi:molybdate transport system ATP-binding protein
MLLCDIHKKLQGFSLDVNIAARPGVTALMGASGCGKSMTLRCIAGVSKPDEGRIELDGIVLFDSEKGINLPPQRRNTGFLFQDYALFPNMTVRQNIMTGAKKKSRDEREAVAKNIAEKFHISAHLNKYPHELSGGQKQRCALARILAGSPDILMLDEPFAALDSHLRWKLEVELAALLKQFDKPVLYVSHNRDEVYRLCDNVVVMNNGRCDAAGDKRSVFKNPKTVQAARLTGCKNIAAAAVKGMKVIIPDWGIEFDWDDAYNDRNQPISHPQSISLDNVYDNVYSDLRDDAFYIGIRANHIVPASAAKGADVAASLPFEIVDETEDTFTYILNVRKRGTDTLPIRWEMPKRDREALRGMPQELAFLREHLLFLR